MEPGGTAWAESVDGIRWIPLVQPEGTPWAESADRIRAIPPVEAGVRGLERRRGPGASAGGGRRGLGQRSRERRSRGVAPRGKKERGSGVLSRTLVGDGQENNIKKKGDKPKRTRNRRSALASMEDTKGAERT